MRGGVTTCSIFSPPRTTSSTIRQRCCSVIRCDNLPFCSSNGKLFSSKFSRISFRCNSTGNSGDNESRTILDAFFLGKAVAEAVNERIESAVGEFLSTVGRLQAEQQKQVQEFQEEVLEKARRAKEQAAREAMEAQGLISKSSTAVDVSTVNGFAVTSTSDSVTIAGPDEDPLSEIPIDD